MSARARLAHLDRRLDGVRVLAPGAPLPVWR
jgi:5-methylcytosine-specific restriction enzyme subunit McrC